jgi:hypothetical protein
MKKHELEHRLDELEQKYFHLVWYARTDPGCIKDGHPAMPGAVEVEMKMPEEVAKLRGDEADWTHGFNSGCLAAFRLVQGLMGNKTEARCAEEEFPFLDT